MLIFKHLYLKKTQYEMSCSTLKRLADSKLKNLYPDQTCYFKNGVLSGLFCELLTSMADQLLDLCSE